MQNRERYMIDKEDLFEYLNKYINDSYPLKTQSSHESLINNTVAQIATKDLIQVIDNYIKRKTKDN